MSIRIPIIYADQNIYIQSMIPFIFQEYILIRISISIHKSIHIPRSNYLYLNHNNIIILRLYVDQSLYAQIIILFVFYIEGNLESAGESEWRIYLYLSISLDEMTENKIRGKDRGGR